MVPGMKEDENWSTTHGWEVVADR